MSGASAARLRHQFVLDTEIVERLEALTAKPGVSKSSIVREALKEWMNREAVPVLDSRFAPRLNQISRQLERIERNGKIALEVQALFVRYMLASIPPVTRRTCCQPHVHCDRSTRRQSLLDRRNIPLGSPLDPTLGQGSRAEQQERTRP